jgi:hypothetical protein
MSILDAFARPFSPSAACARFLNLEGSLIVRSRLAITFVILVAGVSCAGPISDPPNSGAPSDPQDAGVSPWADAATPSNTDDAAAGGGGDAASMDAAVAVPADSGGPNTCPPPDASDSDAGDAAIDGGDAGVDADGAPRPAPQAPDAGGDAAVDAGTPDAAADAGDAELPEAQIVAQPCL